MKRDLEDLVRGVLVHDHRPREDSIQIVRQKRAGKDAVFAVAFEDRDQIQRRGLFGLCRHEGKDWQPSGSFVGNHRVPGDRDVWMTWGGWGPGTAHDRAVAGGWVADPATVSARLVETPAGRVLHDGVENGVFLFMWKRDFDLRDARLELLDADGRVTRSGPLRRTL